MSGNEGSYLNKVMDFLNDVWTLITHVTSDLHQRLSQKRQQKMDGSFLQSLLSRYTQKIDFYKSYKESFILKYLGYSGFLILRTCS